MYCGTEAYGRGCSYSPSKVHVHVDDPKKCIYCGSITYGRGCPFNPTSNIHVHGVEFNNMIRENVHKNFTAAAVLLRLNQPIIETVAYKMELVDELGNRKKIPETLEEKKALTPLDVYIFRLKRYITTEKMELLNSGTILSILGESSKVVKPFDSNIYETETALKERVKFMINEYKSILLDASKDNITTAEIEEMVVECILN
jgi:hypothetical protein